MPTDAKESALTQYTTLNKTADYSRFLKDQAGTPDNGLISFNNLLTTLALKDRVLSGEIAGPADYYTGVRPQIFLYKTLAAITIVSIHIHGPDSTPTTEFAGDLKFADDAFTGSFANATLIRACDTTSGVLTATTGFNDATVPSGKYIYIQMDAAPHIDWKDIFFQILYNFD